MLHIADEIIEELLDRSGFDDWWSDIEENMKDEIVNAIADVIKNNIENRR